MPMLNDAHKTTKSLKHIEWGSLEHRCYVLLQLLDEFMSLGEYRIFTHQNSDGERWFEIIPNTCDAYALKSKIDTELITVTAPLRGPGTPVDLAVLRDAGYGVTLRQISMDEWRITVKASCGQLLCQFIEA
ncbi:hypothetical protein [Companilactobacillus sp.]|uniref:hypothetical protein n=1 Tax=Companilactobacillus sp. TaxID=2767905 RepID=UPI0026339D77|nr:hypothetical protein [Companilactobacillus sp.]